MCSDARRGANIPVNLHPTTAIPEAAPPESSPIGRRRWMICGLLFFAATVNYMDRQVIALLKPTLQIQFGWTEVGYSNIVTAFQFAYGAGLLFIGKLIDRLGTRKGFSLAVFVWSAAAMAHAAAGSIFQFAVARFSLGIGEAGSFPASVKAVAEWFPKRERALTTGLFNSGSNVGALVAPRWCPGLPIAMAGAWPSSLPVRWDLFGSCVGSRCITGRNMTQYFGSRTGLHPERCSGSPTTPRDFVPLDDSTDPREAWAVALGKSFFDPIWCVSVLDAGLPEPQSGLDPERHGAAPVRYL